GTLCSGSEGPRAAAGALDRGPAGHPDRPAELARDDVRERRLPHPRRAVERDVLERVAATLRRVDEDAEVRLHLLLVDVLVVGEALRPQRRFERALALLAHHRRDVALDRALGHYCSEPRT